VIALEELVSRLDAKRRGDGGYMARCPAHEDSTPSLSIGQGDDGRILLKCFAGCTAEQIVKALGLTLRELMPERGVNGLALTLAVLAAAKGLPVDFLRQLGLHDDGRGVAMPYYDRAGAVVYEKRRSHVVAGKGSYLPKGEHPMPYGRERKRSGPDLVTVEGESDCWTLWHHGYDALGLPGTETTKCLEAEDVDGALRVYVVEEPDAAGAKFVGGVRRRLADIGWKGELRVVRLGVKDANELHRLNAVGCNLAFDAAMRDAKLYKPRAPIAATVISAASDDAESHLTDMGNARVFARLFRGQLLFASDMQRWFHWDGIRWSQATPTDMIGLAKGVSRERLRLARAMPEGDTRVAAGKWAFACEGSKRIAACLALAASEPEFALVSGQLDKNPWLLTVENGTIDLKSGELRQHSQDDLITLMSHVSFDKEAKCERWLQFMREVTLGDGALVEYLQRAVGYTLTGITSEQCFFLLHGSGRNGKGKFISIVSALLGELSRTAQFETFLVHQRNPSAASPEYAILRGARLVKASEPDEGARFSEATMKMLTGEDDVTCRDVYGLLFTYRPQFKLWFLANHKPTIRSTDLGTWRRPKPVPFRAHFEEGSPTDDPEIEHKLLAELPGILNWALTGCLEWQSTRLGTCEAVRQAAKTYRAESDLIGRFLEERTVSGKSFFTTCAEIYRAYSTWAKESGEYVMSATAFGKRLSEREIERSKPMGVRGYQGLGLVASFDVPDTAAADPGLRQP
jgi:putative DNA primase/helicase